MSMTAPDTSISIWTGLSPAGSKRAPVGQRGSLPGAHCRTRQRLTGPGGGSYQSAIAFLCSRSASLLPWQEAEIRLSHAIGPLSAALGQTDAFRPAHSRPGNVYF
jgi:hypothetical protein